MGYDRVSRILHWLTALLVLSLIPAGMIMTNIDDRGVQDTLFIFHKNAGAVLLALLVVRLAWRATHSAPPLPGTMPPAQRIAARATHAGLYLFVAIMAISGYIRVRAGGFPIEMLDAIGIGSFVPQDEALAERASAIHGAAKFGIMLFVVVHIAAALRHAMLRDGVFSRMWPPTASRERGA